MQAIFPGQMCTRRPPLARTSAGTEIKGGAGERAARRTFGAPSMHLWSQVATSSPHSLAVIGRGPARLRRTGELEQDESGQTPPPPLARREQRVQIQLGVGVGVSTCNGAVPKRPPPHHNPPHPCRSRGSDPESLTGLSARRSAQANGDQRSRLLNED